MNTNEHHRFMQEAINLSLDNVISRKGTPFGAVVVKDGKIVARGYNQVTANNDPTAHGEIVAIRQACQTLQTVELTGCELYTSCEPCPMCLGAIYWASLKRVYYANTRSDAAQFGFDDQFLYEQFSLPMSDRQVEMICLMRDEALVAFRVWQTQPQ